MSPIDFSSNYVTPGVYTETIQGPLARVQSSTPNAVAVFGLGRGYQSDVQSVRIPTDTPGPASSLIPNATPTFRQKGIDKSSIVVTKVTDGTTFDLTDDYTIIATNGPSGDTEGYDSTYQIKRVVGGSLAAETVVSISYNYTNEYYYTAQRYYDYQDVVDTYGSPYDSSGQIVSEVSLAARFAFINGARNVYVSPVSIEGTPGETDYQEALAKFEGLSDIAIVVCASGDSTYFSAARDHAVQQTANKNERKALLGLDGSVAAISSATRITTATSLENGRAALVGPSTVDIYNPVSQQVQTVGSQYLAAAIAGMAVSQSPALPLTRKQVAGFVSIPNMPEGQKNAEAQAGIMVVDKGINNSSIRIRHGITTDPSNIVTREWSILSQQDALSYRLRSTFDSTGIIGSIITDITLAVIKGTANSVLDSAKSDGIIRNYTNLKARQLIETPDVIEIQFEWQPSLPLNYISARFSINITSGETTVI